MTGNQNQYNIREIVKAFFYLRLPKVRKKTVSISKNV